MDTSEYLGLFLDEGREGLRAMDASLRDLERDGADAAALAALFRAAHTLKGMSAAMGYDAMAVLAHRMEDALAAPRDAGVALTPDRIAALARWRGALGEMLGAVARGEGEAAPPAGVPAELAATLAPPSTVAARTVFAPFPRVVDDLARALGKRAALRLEGGDTALDRAVAERLSGPLLHMLRNAVDHGLEDPAGRVAAGKDPVGTIVLSARRRGAGTVIEVRDDGRGLDPAALRASVVRRGLMDAAAAHALGDEDALQLVFTAGVTTVARATDVSGRGVGMDAVRAAAEALGGRVEVTSAPGAGAAFALRLGGA